MQTIRLTAQVDKDGVLRLEVPVDMPDATVEVEMNVERKQANTTQADWHNFLERMNGILADDPIERGEQGEYEVREALE